MSSPALISHLTLLAEELTSAFARLPKADRSLLGQRTWEHLDALMTALFTSLSDRDEHRHRVDAAAHFDMLKWYLRLLVARKTLSEGWLAARTPELVTIGRMLGGYIRKNPPF